MACLAIFACLTSSRNAAPRATVGKPDVSIVRIVVDSSNLSLAPFLRLLVCSLKALCRHRHPSQWPRQPTGATPAGCVSIVSIRLPIIGSIVKSMAIVGVIMKKYLSQMLGGASRCHTKRARAGAAKLRPPTYGCTSPHGGTPRPDRRIGRARHRRGRHPRRPPSSPHGGCPRSRGATPTDGKARARAQHVATASRTR